MSASSCTWTAGLKCKGAALTWLASSSLEEPKGVCVMDKLQFHVCGIDLKNPKVYVSHN